MSNSILFCSKCMKFKDRTEFSKSQLKKGDARVCIECNKQNVPVVKQESKKSNEIVYEPPAQLFKPLSGIEANKKDQMICLTMHQPWASLLVYGIKRVEGRGWNTDFRGRLWIHAAAKEPTPELIAQYEEHYRDIYRQHGDNINIEFPKHYPTSALLGCVDVVDVLPYEELQKTAVPQSILDEECGSPYVFLCQNYHRLTLPFSLKGEHKLWKMNPRDCKSCQYIMKESISPFPVDFYSIMYDYYKSQNHLYVCYIKCLMTCHVFI